MNYVYTESDHKTALDRFQLKHITFPEFVEGFDNKAYTTVVDNYNDKGYSVLVKMPDSLMIDYHSTNRFSFMFDIFTKIVTVGNKQPLIFAVHSSTESFRSLIEDMYLNKFFRNILQMVKHSSEHYKYITIQSQKIFVDFANVRILRVDPRRELCGIRPFSSISINPN